MTRPIPGLAAAIFCAMIASTMSTSACASGSAGSAAGSTGSADVRGEPVRLGYLEEASLGKRRLSMKAKLDTGADTSSVYARDVRVYKRGERDNWVKFRLIGKDGRSIRYDQNVIRFVHIKTKTGGTIRRPVIHLPLCVGGVSALAEINLADRADFDYDVLVGREFLAHRIIVDSGRSYTAEESCEAADDE